MTRRYGWSKEYRRDDFPALPENTVSKPDTNEPDRTRSATELRKTVGQIADQTNSYGVVVDGRKPSSWTRWLNFADSASAFLKHEKLSLNWDGSATFDGSVTFTGGGLTITDTVVPQLIVRYDASNRLDLSVSSAGAITYDAVGASAGHTFSDAVTANGGITVASAQTLTLTGATVAGAPTWSSNQAITLSTAAQPNVTSLGTLTALTLAGNLTFSGASRNIIAGTTNFSIRDNANLADNLLITDAGAITFRSTVGGITTLTATTIAGTLSTASQPNVTTMAALATIGTLVAGAVPASLVTTGTFGAGAYTFPSALTVSGLLTPTSGVLQTGTQAVRIENTFGSVPSGSAGIGLETGIASSSTYQQSFNRTTLARAPAIFDASSFLFKDGSSGTSGAVTIDYTLTVSGLLTASALANINGTAQSVLTVTSTNVGTFGGLVIKHDKTGGQPLISWQDTSGEFGYVYGVRSSDTLFVQDLGLTVSGLLTANGDFTIRDTAVDATLKLSTRTVMRTVGGTGTILRFNSATSGSDIQWNNFADTFNNMVLTDAGALTLRAGLTAVAGTFSGLLTASAGISVAGDATIASVININRVTGDPYLNFRRNGTDYALIAALQAGTTQGVLDFQTKTDGAGVVSRAKLDSAAYYPTTAGSLTLGIAILPWGAAWFNGLLTASGGLTVASGQTLTLTGTTVAGAPTWSSNQAITLSTAAQSNITSLGTLTGLTIGGNLTFTGASRKLVPGITGFSWRNNADTLDNLIITDAGAATFRSTVDGITALTATGRVTFNGDRVDIGDVASMVFNFGARVRSYYTQAVDANELNAYFEFHQTVAASTRTLHALEGHIDADHTTGTVATIVGVTGLVRSMGVGGTTNWLRAFDGRLAGAAGSVATNAASFFANPGGVATNIYGFYAQQSTVGTNRYGLYTESVSGGTLNYAIYTNAGLVRFGDAVTLVGALDHDGTTVGFYGTVPIVKQTGVAVTAAAVHAALVNLGLIAA